MTSVPIPQLRQVARDILLASGHPPDEAEIILDVLMYAQLRGNNQGVIKLVGAGLPHNPQRQPPRIIQETPVSALIDGGQGTGMVVLTKALEIALERARRQGMALVGTRNTQSSTGAIGFYAARAAREGFIAFVFAGSGEYVAMAGSYEPIFGTNPLAIGVPAPGGEPIVLDMATSAIARFGIVEAQTAGRAIPPDVAYDAHGQPTTDPTAALAGAIRTFGGIKGAGLALMVELLTGALVGTTRDAAGHKQDWGTLILLFSPTLFGESDEFLARVGQVIERVKQAKKLPGTEEVLVPGERGSRVMAAAYREGSVELDAALWAALRALTPSDAD